MERREFLKLGAYGIGGLALQGSGMGWLAEAAAAGPAGTPWKFGVMADTQWKKNVDGLNPGTCAVGIIERLNERFIDHGVKFVIQVGDLCDVETDALNGNPAVRTASVRAAAAQSLYDAGIGFYPLRGNHEASATAANEFVAHYPQARGVGGKVLGGAANFTSPFGSLNGLSYSFDVGGARFVLLDQFTRLDGSGVTADNNTVDQLGWIDRQLSERPSDSHAFVFSHKNLVGQNHVDCLFGANPGTNLGARDAFIGSLESNGVRYAMGGHDHMHHRSIVKSPDGSSAVKQLICSSNSYKFYIPQGTSNDESYNHPALETPIGQELFTIGYYIFTVDGPRVTVDFYSSSHGSDYGDIDLVTSPSSFAFFKRETWGYSLNGREFLVAQGDHYTKVSDTFNGTTAKILSGVNGSVATDAAHRALCKTVNTGWTKTGAGKLGSDILNLWGMADNLAMWDQSLTGLLPNAAASQQADTFTLSLSYDNRTQPTHLGNGGFGIAAADANGAWVNAVDLNVGGTKRFVQGAWNPGYGLGTYGVDPSSKTAWAVLNRDGVFAASQDIESGPRQRA